MAYRLSNHPVCARSFSSLPLFSNHASYLLYILVSEHAQSTLTSSQPTAWKWKWWYNVLIHVHRRGTNSAICLCQTTSSNCRLNTLAHRQAHTVFMHACDCTQSNANTYIDIKKTHWKTYMCVPTDWLTCTNYAACQTSPWKCCISNLPLICQSMESLSSVGSFTVSEALFASIWLSQTDKPQSCDGCDFRLP